MGKLTRDIERFSHDVEWKCANKTETTNEHLKSDLSGLSIWHKCMWLLVG